MKIFDGERAVSPVLSVSLLVLITFSAGILLYNFVIGTVGSVTEKLSPQPFSLFIKNVSINNTCITVYIRNSGNNDATIDSAYVNDEPRDILPLTNNKVLVPKGLTGKVYILGSYTVGTSYNVKLVFTSGHTLTSLNRY